MSRTERLLGSTSAYLARTARSPLMVLARRPRPELPRRAPGGRAVPLPRIDGGAIRVRAGPGVASNPRTDAGHLHSVPSRKWVSRPLSRRWRVGQSLPMLEAIDRWENEGGALSRRDRRRPPQTIRRRELQAPVLCLAGAGATAHPGPDRSVPGNWPRGQQTHTSVGSTAAGPMDGSRRSADGLAPTHH